MCHVVKEQTLPECCKFQIFLTTITNQNRIHKEIGIRSNTGTDLLDVVHVPLCYFTCFST
jgi:hypothetical protein